MTRTRWTARFLVAGALALTAVPLAACGEVNEAIGKADGAMGKAAACSEALGIVSSFDPASLDPQQIPAQAGQKAGRLRELGIQVAEQPVKDSLFAAAETYADLERKQADGLTSAAEWARRNSDNLSMLRQVCL